MNTKLRAGAALVLALGLALGALVSAGRQVALLRQQSRDVHLAGDDLTQWGNRLEPLLPYLPASGEVGYISEQDIPGLSYSATDVNEEMAMSQYALAPRILVQGAAQPLVIGNIASLDPAEVEAAAGRLGLKLERSFGLGIYLFRREQP